jgi:hypothetical protein
MKILVKILLVSIVTLLLFRPQQQFYQPVYYGTFEVYIKGTYTETIRKYTTYWHNGNKYYCYTPNNILNSQETIKLNFCLIESDIEIR